MAADFVLRRLGALELDLASGLHGAAFAPVGERVWTRQDMAGLLASPGVAGWALQSGDRAIGFALCRVTADEAELLTIAVQPDQRRRGAGRALLAAVTAHARAAGARSLFLEVGADNPAALALYGHAAFPAVGRRKAYYQPGGGLAARANRLRVSLPS